MITPMAMPMIAPVLRLPAAPKPRGPVHWSEGTASPISQQARSWYSFPSISLLSHKFRGRSDTPRHSVGTIPGYPEEDPEEHLPHVASSPPPRYRNASNWHSVRLMAGHCAVERITNLSSMVDDVADSPRTSSRAVIRKSMPTTPRNSGGSTVRSYTGAETVVPGLPSVKNWSGKIRKGKGNQEGNEDGKTLE